MATGDWRARARRRPGGAGGWTIIELVIVIAIIVVLASIAMTNYANAVTRAQEAVLKEDLFRMRDAIDQYYADKAKYPTSLEELVEGEYLRAIPEDPFTQSRETWQLVMSEPDPTDPSLEPGVRDVRSGSDRMSMSGQPYAEW
ncbi:MAG: hypothetical protein KJ061_00955 [Vicinamibacteraceae bacterium]|nr:hypothetical protein [Vicinamibacteraceae bacterium]